MKNSLTGFSESKNVTEELDNRKSENKSNENGKLGVTYWLFIIIVGFFLFNLSVKLQKSCSLEDDFFTNSNENDENDSNEPVFNDTIARFHLKSISRLGRRPVGSVANEVHTPSYLLKYLEELKIMSKKDKLNNIAMEIDEQIASLNSFPITLFGRYHISQVYNQIRNIVVKLHDTHFHKKSSAILVNCHYDSYFDGPGASDDLVSCAVLLESIRALVTSHSVTLKHDLIFLFNGAEENMLQASHAFISQHRWAKDVKLFINLEAAGSGGRQMIFQTSSNNPWLINEISSVIKQPLGNVIGQEIFSANLIPSDTDFRIFRDFGQLPGIDIAFIANGYVYHTRQDTENRIPQACIQNTGHNILKLSIKLANSALVDTIVPETPLGHHLDASEKSSLPMDSSFQRIVYFDFLGLTLISYNEFTGICLNISVALFSLLIIIFHSHSGRLDYLKNVLIATLAHFIFIFTLILLSATFGYMIHSYGCRLSWYSNRFNLIGLYILPNLWWYFLYYQLICPKLFPKLTAQMLQDAVILLMVGLMALLTWGRFLSSYFITIWLIFLICRQFFHFVIVGLLKLDKIISVNLIYFFIDSTCFTLPLTYYFYMIFIVFDFFIPVFGRSGFVPADLIMSVITTFSMIIPCLIVLSNIYLTSYSAKKWLIFVLLHSTISYYLFLHLTNFGFPYNQSDVMPRKQRVVFNHITRNIRNDLGQIEISESGIWMIGLDVNRMDTLKAHLEKIIREPMHPVFCELRPYCGYPLLYPIARLVDHTMWLPSTSHSKRLHPPPTLVPLSKITHISGMVNLTLELSGPSHSHLFIMTPKSMRLVGWSLGPNAPKPIEMPSPVLVTEPHRNLNDYDDPNIVSNPYSDYLHYFIYNSYGVKPSKRMKLWITFLPKKLSNLAPINKLENQIEIALSAHYLLADTPELESILHIIPKWVTPSTLASTYEHIVVDFDKDLTYNQ